MQVIIFTLMQLMMLIVAAAHLSRFSAKNKIEAISCRLSAFAILDHKAMPTCMFAVGRAKSKEIGQEGVLEAKI